MSPPVSFTRSIPRLLFAVLLTGDTLEPMTRHVFILNNCKAAVKGAPADSKDSSHPDLNVPRGSAAAHQLCASSLASHSTHLRPRRGKNLIPRTGMSHLTDEEEMLLPLQYRRGGEGAHANVPHAHRFYIYLLSVTLFCSTHTHCKQSSSCYTPSHLSL